MINNKKMTIGIIEYTEEAPGMIRVESVIDGVLTKRRYLQIARNLLEKGLPLAGNEELKDSNSVDLMDNMLLYDEENRKRQSQVKIVVFNVDNKEYIVNNNNINRFEQELNPTDSKIDSYRETIMEAMRE